MRKRKDTRVQGNAASRTRICGIFLCFGVWLFLIQNRLVQGQIPTSLAITGSVQDQSGAAFLGAQVDLLKDELQQRTTTTDTSGAFRTLLQFILQRSEEHTSELQSPYDLVCRLLLEKKNKKKQR